MAQNSRQTGSRAASVASRTLRSPNATKAERSAAASALAQTGSHDQTGPRAASAAGKTWLIPARRSRRSQQQPARCPKRRLAGSRGAGPGPTTRTVDERFVRFPRKRWR